MASPAAFRGPALGASTPGARVVDRRASSRSPASPTARAARPGPRGRAPVARAARSRTGALASSPRHRASIGVARRPRGRALRATDDANEPPGTASSAESSASVLRVAASVADSRWFNTYLHAAVVVFILGFLDAGFSRDWTRIGAITPEVEQRLRDLAGVLGGVHVVAALAAAATAKARGLPVAPAAAKTALVGFLAFVEVCFKTVPPAEEEA